MMFLVKSSQVFKFLFNLPIMKFNVFQYYDINEKIHDREVGLQLSLIYIKLASMKDLSM